MADFGAPNFRLLGSNALVLDLPGPRTLAKQTHIWRLHRRARTLEGVTESVPGMNNLTLLFQPEVADDVTLRAALLDALSEAEEAAESPRSHVVPVRYGGEHGCDLRDVCRLTGLSEREVIARHCAIEYRVYFVGFQPGFAYLGDLDERLALPRRAHPRVSVPAGSVAIAGRQTAVYPFASPGGWNIIGATSVGVFDAAREPAALFAAGDIVRFVEAS